MAAKRSSSKKEASQLFADLGGSSKYGRMASVPREEYPDVCCFCCWHLAVFADKDIQEDPSRQLHLQNKDPMTSANSLK